VANVTKLTTKTDSAGKPLIHADADDGKSYEWSAADVSQGPGPTPLPPPSGLMAHWNQQAGAVDLMWQAVQGAGSYPIYRGTDPNNLPQLNEAPNGQTTWSDKVTQTSSDQTFLYAVATRSTDGVTVGAKSATVSVVVPASGGVIPPPSGGPDLPAPNNLRAKGVQSGGKWTDQLNWDGNYPNYNIYVEDRKIGSATGKSFLVPGNEVWPVAYYTVTGVDANGQETRQSAPCLAMLHGNRGYDPTNPLPTPSGLKTTPEWNNGKGRVVLTWKAGAFYGHTYNVYRDGQKYATEIPLQYFADENVNPGQTHTYAVSCVGNTIDAPHESPQSAVAVGAAPSSGPPQTPGTLAVKSVTPNHNSCTFEATPVPGAVDYRCYDQAHPDHCKYSGGSLFVEMNGLDPNNPPTIIMEALDKLGPFQRMDGTMVASDCWVSKARFTGMPPTVHTNGHGDPSNMPNVLARSAGTKAQFKPKTLSGNPAFLDNFDSNQPFTQLPKVDDRIYARHSWTGKPNNDKNPYLKAFTNDKWRYTEYWNNAQATKCFFMARHLMDTLYDGGVVGPNPEGDSSPPHNANASNTFEPAANGTPLLFDVGNGKVLHITMEVDPFFNPRRWCDIGFLAGGDALLDPAIEKLDFSKKMAPTQSGGCCVWEIMSSLGNMRRFIPDGANSGHYASIEDLFDHSYPGDHKPPMSRDQGNPPLNGDQGYLDRRTNFDLFTDGKRFVLVQGKTVLKDASIPTAWPAGKVSVWYSHHIYHDVNDLSENARADIDFWVNYRQDADMRHWCNMGAESLNGWPATFP